MSLDEKRIRWLHRDAQHKRNREVMELCWIEREQTRLKIREAVVMGEFDRSKNKFKRSMEILDQLYYVNHTLNLYYFKLNKDYAWWPDMHEKMKMLVDLQNNLQDEFFEDNPEKLPYRRHEKLNPYARLLLGVTSLINFNRIYNVITEIDLDVPIEPLPLEEALNSI